MAWAGPAPSMVTLIPRKGLQSPSVRTIFLRASYTLLYRALGSGCRLCIRVCNKAHEGEASVTQLSATNPTVQSYHNSKIIEGSVQLLDVPYLSYFFFIFILVIFLFILLDGVHAPIVTCRLFQEGKVTSALLYPWKVQGMRRLQEGSVTSAPVYPWKVQGMRLLWLLQRPGEEIQGRL